MKYLVTGAAGFIGFHVAKQLLTTGHSVVGVDNLNDYYDPSLKAARLAILQGLPGFTFYCADISDKDAIRGLQREHSDIGRIIHLAAQAGVRYSLTNPYAYAQANLVGQVVMLELARNLSGCEHFVYASSSSVYGANTKLPFSVEDRVDHPVSLYAATKKSCELLAHSYSHIYHLRTTGLRFFTVYGPWGRPDMSAFLFVKAILEDQPIRVFNGGDMQRDFTYIDDIVRGVIAITDRAAPELPVPYEVFNIGNHRSEPLMHFIDVIQTALGRKARMVFEPMQAGDVKATYADIDATRKAVGFEPSTSIEVGIPRFVEWYRSYYRV